MKVSGELRFYVRIIFRFLKKHNFENFELATLFSPAVWIYQLQPTKISSLSCPFKYLFEFSRAFLPPQKRFASPSPKQNAFPFLIWCEIHVIWYDMLRQCVNMPIFQIFPTFQIKKTLLCFFRFNTSPLKSETQFFLKAIWLDLDF